MIFIVLKTIEDDLNEIAALIVKFRGKPVIRRTRYFRIDKKELRWTRCRNNLGDKRQKSYWGNFCLQSVLRNTLLSYLHRFPLKPVKTRLVRNLTYDGSAVNLSEIERCTRPAMIDLLLMEIGNFQKTEHWTPKVR